MTDQIPWFEQAPHSLAIMERGAVAEAVAAMMVGLIRGVLERRQYATIVPSAGRTHLETLSVLRRQYAQALDWRRVVCVQMDEYADVGSADARSLSAQIERELVGPLQIGRFIRFYDAAGHAHCDLQAYERDIDALGGIDCAIHGVGVNGHIGFNEPHSEPATHTRRVELARTTRVANGVSFTHGVTLGFNQLVAARMSIVVLLGAEKRTAASELLFGSPGPHNPVGNLRHCPQVRVFMDQAAVPAAAKPLAGGVWPHKVR